MIAETMISGSSFSSAITITKSSGTKLTFLTSNKFVDRNMELEINAQSASLDLAGGGLINESLSFGGTGLSFTSLSSSGSIRYVGPLTVTASAFKEAVTVNSDINGWVNAASGTQVVAADSMALSSNAYLSGATFGSSQGMIITSPDILNSGYTVDTLAVADGNGEFQFDIADASAFIRQIKNNKLSGAYHPACRAFTNSELRGSYASKNTYLENIYLPVCASIGMSVFSYCVNLNSVSFPVCRTIGNGAFAYCSSLTSVSFPACTSIGTSAFSQCSSLTSVSFPACTYIGSDAFAYCSSLTSVSFSVCTYIGSGAFSQCSSLTSVSFPACTSIRSGAFWNCSSLTSVSFPVCTYIGSGAFAYCSSLTSVSFPACRTIEISAFIRCLSLTSISFPACTIIYSSAFYGCSSLTSVSLPACINIGSSAFYSCFNLTSVSLPACMTIGASVFRGCYNLLSLYLTGSSLCSLPYSNAFTSTPIAGYTTSTGGVYGSIYVPALLVDQYKSASNWSYFSNRIVPYGAFESATGVSF